MEAEIRREMGEHHGVIARVASELADCTPAEVEATHYRGLSQAKAA